TVAEVRGEVARISGSNWELWGQLRSDLHAGQSATGVIRIEKTRITDQPIENALAGRLETALYLGERWDYLFAAGGQQRRIWAEAPPAQNPSGLHLLKKSFRIFGTLQVFQGVTENLEAPGWFHSAFPPLANDRSL